MNKKQKKTLIRIVIAAILFLPLYLISEDMIHLEVPRWSVFLFFLILLAFYGGNGVFVSLEMGFFCSAVFSFALASPGLFRPLSAAGYRDVCFGVFPPER